LFDKLFPESFYNYLKKIPLDKVTEIRLRLNKKVLIAIGQKYYYLSTEGLTGKEYSALVVDKSLIDEIIKRACESSVYAFNDQIKNGFITVLGGMRIGISGEAVFENGRIKTLKNINGLAIRIAHEIKGCSLPVLPYLFNKNFLNTLIISPPGAGKTTMIRDMLYQLSQKNYCYNVLLVDERFEIANCFNGVATLDVGNFCDVLSGCDKKYSFENGVRSLKPDIIVTDEISNIKDYDSIEYLHSCGVSILASVHAKNIEDIKNKKDFENLLKNKVFSRYVILSNNGGPGHLEAIYDENLRYLNI